MQQLCLWRKWAWFFPNRRHTLNSWVKEWDGMSVCKVCKALSTRVPGQQRELRTSGEVTANAG